MKTDKYDNSPLTLGDKFLPETDSCLQERWTGSGCPYMSGGIYSFCFEPLHSKWGTWCSQKELQEPSSRHWVGRTVLSGLNESGLYQEVRLVWPDSYQTVNTRMSQEVCFVSWLIILYHGKNLSGSLYFGLLTETDTHWVWSVVGVLGDSYWSLATGAG